MEGISWGFCRRGGGGVGGFAGSDGDEVKVGFVSGAAAVSWRKVGRMVG